MINRFVEEFLVKKKVLVPAFNAYGPSRARMSVNFNGEFLQLVIGANWEDRYSEEFDKESLGELIQMLTEIKNAEWK